MCVALYEYQDEDEKDDSRSAWCAPGSRVDILEETNPDWHKVCTDLSILFRIELKCKELVIEHKVKNPWFYPPASL